MSEAAPARLGRPAASGHRGRSASPASRVRPDCREILVLPEGPVRRESRAARGKTASMANQVSDPKSFEVQNVTYPNDFVFKVHLDLPDSEARQEKMVFLVHLASLVRRDLRENLVLLVCPATKGHRARLETR